MWEPFKISPQNVVSRGTSHQEKDPGSVKKK